MLGSFANRTSCLYGSLGEKQSNGSTVDLQVHSEKARRYLSSMRKKPPIPFTQKFPGIDPLALQLLERMLAFDPSRQPTATEALADSYFKGLAKVEWEPAAQGISEMEFEFERRRVTEDDVRELIYREVRTIYHLNLRLGCLISL